MGDTGTSANPLDPSKAAIERPRTRPPGEMGPLARFFGVFTAPGKTFASIARWPGKDWLLPAGLLLVVSLVATLIATPKVDVDAAVQRTMTKIEERRELPADQRQQTEQMVRKQFEMGTRGPLRFMGVLFVILPMLIVPLIYHGVAAAFGKQTSYGRVLTAYAFVQVVQLVKSLLFLVVAASKSSLQIHEMATLVKSNVGAFLDPDATPAFLRAVATNLDVFEVWALILGTMAVSRVTKLTTGGAAMLVGGLWLVYVLVSAGFAALGAAFGGG